MRNLLIISAFMVSIMTVASEYNMDKFNEAMDYYKNRKSDFAEIQSYEKFRALAEFGDTRSMLFTYLVFYEFNSSLSDKATEAVKFLVEAARRDDHEAQYYLGFIISNGIFVNKDVELANKWLMSSAKLGNRQASTLLGVNLAKKYMANLEKNKNNTLLVKEFNQIRHYLRYAEELNDAHGIFSLATVIFFHEKDLVESRRLLLIAKKLGHDYADELLNDLDIFESID